MLKASESRTFYVTLNKLYLFVLLTRSSTDGLLALMRGEEGGFTAGAVLNVFVLALGLACLICAKRKSAVLPAVVWVPYLVSMIVSLIYTPDFSDGLRLVLSVLTYPMMFVTGLVLATDQEQFKTILRTVVWSSIVPCIFVLMQLAGYYLPPDGRISGSFSHANILGFYCTAVFFSLMCLDKLEQNQSFVMKSGRFICTMLSLVVLILTEARGAWIGAFFLIAVYIIFVKRWLLIITPLLPLVLFIPSISSRLSDISDDSYSASSEQVTTGAVVLNSYAWRQMLWSYAIADSENARVLGKGAGAFRHNGASFFPLQGGAETANGVDAHSGYIQSLYELGVVGLLCYIAVYLGLVPLIFLTSRDVLGVMLTAFIFANMVFNYSDNVLYYLSYNWYVWAILGSAIGYRNSQLAYGRITLAPVEALLRFKPQGFRNHFYRPRTDRSQQGSNLDVVDPPNAQR